MPVGRRVKRVPSDKNGARPLVGVKAKQEVRKPDDRACSAAVAASDRLRQAVIGAVREGIPIDDKKRPVAAECSRARYVARSLAFFGTWLAAGLCVFWHHATIGARW